MKHPFIVKFHLKEYQTMYLMVLGGESIYGHPFKDEFHSRLRFVRRGLVAMANAGKDDNASQFFFTMGPTQELQNKHTIFGKVVGGKNIFGQLGIRNEIYISFSL